MKKGEFNQLKTYYDATIASMQAFQSELIELINKASEEERIDLSSQLNEVSTCMASFVESVNIQLLSGYIEVEQVVISMKKESNEEVCNGVEDPFHGIAANSFLSADEAKALSNDIEEQPWGFTSASTMVAAADLANKKEIAACPKEIAALPKKEPTFVDFVNWLNSGSEDFESVKGYKLLKSENKKLFKELEKLFDFKDSTISLFSYSDGVLTFDTGDYFALINAKVLKKHLNPKKLLKRAVKDDDFLDGLIGLEVYRYDCKFFKEYEPGAGKVVLRSYNYRSNGLELGLLIDDSSTGYIEIERFLKTL